MGELGWVLVLASWVGLSWVHKLMGWVVLGTKNGPTSISDLLTASESLPIQLT